MKFKKRIMIVDDNLIDRKITERILRTNYVFGDLIVVENGMEGLAYLDSHLVESAPLPNIILLDLDMPITNGLQFLDSFSKYTDEIKSSCKVIVLTASDVESDIEKVSAHPQVYKLLAKPLSKNDLTGVI